MRNKKVLITSIFSLIICLVCILNAFAHPGKTDTSGGHEDNDNVSGLGSYHYHCGVHPAHLHTNDVCPYNIFSDLEALKRLREEVEEERQRRKNNVSTAEENTSASKKTSDYKEGYAEGYKEGRSEGQNIGFKSGYNYKADEVSTERKKELYILLISIIVIVVIVLIVKFIKKRRKE